MITSQPATQDSGVPAVPDHMEREAYPPEPRGQEQNLAARNARVADIARLLIAQERARTQRSKPLDRSSRRIVGGQERWPFAESGPR